MLLSGVLAGIGGAYLSIGQSSLFTRNMTSGRGFIALAALIFGKWRPVQTLLACLLFGFTEAVSIQMQGVMKLPSGEDIPVQFIQMVPYVLTIMCWRALLDRRGRPALGIPYQKESKVVERKVVCSHARCVTVALQARESRWTATGIAGGMPALPAEVLIIAMVEAISFRSLFARPTRRADDRARTK